MQARQADEREAAHQDVEDLRAHVQEFVRRFGLLVTRQTRADCPSRPRTRTR